MRLLASTFYIAQAYGCGTYGQSGYDECAQQSSPAGQSSPGDQTQLQQTATPEQSGDFLEPSETTTQPSQPQTTASPMAGIGFEMILFLAFLAALAIAFVIFFLKRRRGKQLDQFSGPTTPSPST